MKENVALKHENSMLMDSRYCSNFDLIMHRYITARFEGLLAKKRVIELGTYKGDMTEKIAELAEHVTCVDHDQECLNSVLKRLSSFDLNIACCDFADFENYGDADTILFSHSLEHCTNRVQLLKKIRSKMTAGASLITIVPNGQSLSRKIAKQLGIVKQLDEVTRFEREIGHQTTYTLDTLISDMQAAGFSISDSGGLVPKIFSNYQIDQALSAGIIDLRFLDALNELSEELPHLCSSIFTVVEK